MMLLMVSLLDSKGFFNKSEGPALENEKALSDTVLTPIFALSGSPHNRDVQKKFCRFLTFATKPVSPHGNNFL
jgi:hypothetical protein